MGSSVKAEIDGSADISLSAGNTGVLLVISRMILKMINDVSKPALAGLWPNQNGMNVVPQKKSSGETKYETQYDTQCHTEYRTEYETIYEEKCEQKYVDKVKSNIKQAL